MIGPKRMISTLLHAATVLAKASLASFSAGGRRLLAEGRNFSLESTRGVGERGIARADDLGERGLGDRRMIRLGPRT